MLYKVWDDMSCCTEADAERLLSAVSPSRMEKALKYKYLKGKWSCLKTGEMLHELLSPASPALPDFAYNQYGKPYIDGMPDFSISHCPAALAVAVADIDKNIGIDIETVREYNETLSKRVMSEEEQQIIDSGSSKQTAFTLLWTLKEAYLKYIGTGITDELTGTLHCFPVETKQHLVDEVCNSGDNETASVKTATAEISNKNVCIDILTLFAPAKGYVMSVIEGRKI